MHGVAQQDTIELSDLSGICFYNRLEADRREFAE